MTRLQRFRKEKETNDPEKSLLNLGSEAGTLQGQEFGLVFGRWGYRAPELKSRSKTPSSELCIAASHQLLHSVH